MHVGQDGVNICSAPAWDIILVLPIVEANRKLLQSGQERWQLLRGAGHLLARAYNILAACVVLQVVLVFDHNLLQRTRYRSTSHDCMEPRFVGTAIIYVC